LPFRVICVLGTNDGDFPRREPAAGLNRLTAELGTARRRDGDRSTREDDRFLFLQLFAAAQDVFYVSWQGADPRDGSAREPSVLVSELIAAAAGQHVPEANAADALVVHHPLQPFSPAAFGATDPTRMGRASRDPDPRRFSYRKAWHQVASHTAAKRVPLPPWFGNEALPAQATAPGDNSHDSLSIETLRRFLLRPAEAFLLQRLDLRLDAIEQRDPDV